jgi:Na+/H+-dicarboxylate symporter
MGSKNNDQNYVSLWFWFFAIFIMALPCINVIMILVWAIMGENQSRKNYFRALILWFVLWTVLWGVLVALGFAQEIAPWVAKQIEVWRRHLGA